jgi:predicted ATP-dependent endonuclease of OLD family
MQIELSKEELSRLIDWGYEFDEHDDLSDDLYDRINRAYLEAEELESLDLNDCGDACKL